MAHPTARLEPRDNRLAYVGGAGRQRVAGGVGGPYEGSLDDRGGRVDRGTHAEVDDPTGRGSGPRLEGDERIPREIGQGAHGRAPSSR